MISKNLFQRLIVSIIFIPVILFLVFRGGELFLYFILILVALGTHEYLIRGNLRLVSLIYLIPFIGNIAIVYFMANSRLELAWLVFLAIFILTGMAIVIRSEPTEILFPRLKYIVWGTIYIGFLFPFLYTIRGEAHFMEPSPGRWWLFLLLGSVWLCDSAAQLFGSRLGRHKLAPVVSPNKTVEGFIGGIIGALLAALIFHLFWIKEAAFIHLLAISILVAFFGQIGDLVESLWKRSINIKDSSNIIPGHGGVLDRFDSLLFASPVVYIYLKYILQASWL